MSLATTLGQIVLNSLIVQYHTNQKCRSPELVAIGDKVLIPDSICYRGILLYCLSLRSFIVKEDVVHGPLCFHYFMIAVPIEYEILQIRETTDPSSYRLVYYYTDTRY